MDRIPRRSVGGDMGPTKIPRLLPWSAMPYASTCMETSSTKQCTSLIRSLTSPIAASLSTSCPMGLLSIALANCFSSSSTVECSQKPASHPASNQASSGEDRFGHREEESKGRSELSETVEEDQGHRQAQDVAFLAANKGSVRMLVSDETWKIVRAEKAKVSFVKCRALICIDGMLKGL